MLLALVILVRSSTAAAGLCASMQPMCAGLSFPAAVGSTVEETGNDYGCLQRAPNPAWYYLRMATPGEMRMLLSGSADVDFALWGPYPSLESAVSTCGVLP